MKIWTVGHSTHRFDTFVELLTEHGIALLADIRTVPKSRRHPHFDTDALAQSLAHLSPEAVLTRGYALVTTREGTVVFDAKQVAPSDPVLLRFGRGSAEATITRSEP